MSRAAAAAAERWFGEHRRSYWPRWAYAYDDDTDASPEHRVFTEAPHAAGVVVVEYKSVLAGPLDLDGLQYRAQQARTNPAVPYLVVQFSSPPQPVAFRLHPANPRAAELCDHEPATLAEVGFVAFLHALAGTGQALRVPVVPAVTFDGRTNRYAEPCPRCALPVAAGRGLLGRLRNGRQQAWHAQCRPVVELSDATVTPEPAGLLDTRIPDPAVWPAVRAPHRMSTVAAAAPGFLNARAYLRGHAERDTPARVAVARLLPVRLPTGGRPSFAQLRRERLAAQAAVPAAVVLDAEWGLPLADVEAAQARAAQRVAHATRALHDATGFDPNSGGRDVWRDRYAFR